MLVNIYKPKDYSSFAIVKQVKKITKQKVGHSGTLDPFADGVLLIGIGSSTKLLTEAIQFDKSYKATLQLGSKTDSMDLTGEIIERAAIPNISQEFLDTESSKLIGEQLQRTPMFSARKIDGVRLYKLARKSIEVKTNPKMITIFNLDCSINHESIQMDIQCSSGTYIRVLGEDLAERLGTVGHLTHLTRTSIGKYTLKDSMTVDKFEEVWKSLNH